MDKMESIYYDSVQNAKKGDMQAFQSLYDQSVVTFRKIAMKYMKNVYDADDVLQDAYMKIFQNINTLDDPDKFMSWGSRICKNTALNAIRKKDVFQEHQEYRTTVSDDDQTGLDVIPVSEYDTNFNPEANIDAQETKRLLDEMLDQLPEMQRACILLWQEQYSTREIAEQLGIPEGTVKSNINYAKKKIKENVLDLEKKGTKLYGMAPMVFFLWLVWKYNSGFRPSVPDNTSAASFSKIAEKAQSVSAGGNQAGENHSEHHHPKDGSADISGELNSQKPEDQSSSEVQNEDQQFHSDTSGAGVNQEAGHEENIPSVQQEAGGNSGEMNAKGAGNGTAEAAAGAAAHRSVVRIVLIYVAIAAIGVVGGGAYAGIRSARQSANTEVDSVEEPEVYRAATESINSESEEDSSDVEDSEQGDTDVTDSIGYLSSDSAATADEIADSLGLKKMEQTVYEIPLENYSTENIYPSLFDTDGGYLSANLIDLDHDYVDELLILYIKGTIQNGEGDDIYPVFPFELDVYEDTGTSWEKMPEYTLTEVAEDNSRISMFINQDATIYLETYWPSYGDGNWNLDRFVYDGNETDWHGGFMVVNRSKISFDEDNIVPIEKVIASESAELADELQRFDIEFIGYKSIMEQDDSLTKLFNIDLVSESTEDPLGKEIITFTGYDNNVVAIGQETDTDSQKNDSEKDAATEAAATQEDSEENASAEETQNGEYILPESDSRYYTQEELSDLSQEQLLLARNEIYARHGRKFQTDDIREYFESQPWYQGTVEPDDFSDSVFNEYERANIDLLVSMDNSVTSN